MSLSPFVPVPPAAVPLAHPPGAPASLLACRRVHLIGIGGCGMSGIALALHANGVLVTGSDISENAAVSRLRQAGISVQIGHDSAHVAGADAVIYSTAIRRSNPEWLAAKDQGIRVWHRGEALAEFLCSRQSILAIGTHGKTTTSAMMGLALEAAGFDPWVFVGGLVPAFAGNTRVGGLQWAVAEADESDGTFERLPANHLVLTNVEGEHLDFWGSEDAMKAAYRRVLEGVAEGGKILACIDDTGACELKRSVDRPVLGYSVRAGAGHYSAGRILLNGCSSSFDLHAGKVFVRRFEVGVPGLQNVSNAVGVLGLALELGADPDAIAPALAAFRGVGRRFDIRGRANGITVIDDYAHHPTEISATINAARAMKHETGGRLLVAFQPHRYTRTRDLMKQFGAAFVDADHVFLCGIYSAGEEPIEGVTVEALYEVIARANHGRCELVHERPALGATVAAYAQENDIVLTLGAGDIGSASGEIVQLLSKRDFPGGSI